MSREVVDPMIRLLQYIEVVGDHWMWTGSVFHDNAITSYQGKKISAHRLRLILETGYDLGEGWDSAHTCEFVLCIRHTRWLTHRDNLLEHTVTITHCKQGHEFTEENTRVDNRGARYCVECSRIRGKRYFAANKELIYARRRV